MTDRGDRTSELFDRISDLIADGEYPAAECLDAMLLLSIHILRNEIEQPVEVAAAQFRYAAAVGEALLRGKIGPEDCVPWNRRS